MSDSTTATTPAAKAPWLSNKAYDQLKWVAQYGLPALGAFYFGLAQLWGFPYAVEVIGTIALLDVLLGVVLGVSTKSYNASGAQYDGDFIVSKDASGNPTQSLAFNVPLAQLQGNKQVVLKVVDSQN
jgi:hypothetical protein